MGKILRILAVLAVFSFLLPTRVGWSRCSDSSAEILITESQDLLLRGATFAAQGALHRLHQQSFCQQWSAKEISMYLYLKGVYYHLQDDRDNARLFLLREEDFQIPEFGTLISQYALQFVSPNGTSKYQFHYSRFQNLWIDGIQYSDHQITMSEGIHLLQLTDPQHGLIYTKWLHVEPSQNKRFPLPRRPPNWPLYLGLSQVTIGAFSLWMKTNTEKNMEQALDEDTFYKEAKAYSLWNAASITTLSIGSVSLLFYFVW